MITTADEDEDKDKDGDEEEDPKTKRLLFDSFGASPTRLEAEDNKSSGCGSDANSIVSDSNVGVGTGAPKFRYIVSDSEATRHMFHNKDHFTKYRETTNHHYKVANGLLFPVFGT